MSEDRESFVFHKDWYYAIKKRSPQLRIEIYDAIMEKVFEGTQKELSEVASVVMDLISPQIDRDTARWLDIKAKRRESGKQGGLAKQANATKCYQMLPNDSKSKQNVANLPVSVSDSVSVSVSDSVVTKDVNKELSSLHSDNNISTKVDTLSSPNWADNFVKFFNATIDKNNSVIAKVRIIQGNREKQLKARIKQYGEESVCEAVTKATLSPFLNGQKGFIASIDWILKPNNFPKILEGNYDKRETSVFRTAECEQTIKRKQIERQTLELMQEYEHQDGSVPTGAEKGFVPF